MFEGYRKLSIREIQQLQLELMDYLHDFCVKRDLKYYLIAGSALGAARHKGFIPWDDDIDIALPRKDYDRFKKEFQDIKSNYLLIDYDNCRDYSAGLLRICIKDTILDIKSERHLHDCKEVYLDVFPLDNIPDDESERIEHEKRISKLKKSIRRLNYRIYEKDTPLRVIVKKIFSKFYSLRSNLQWHTDLRKEMKKYSDLDTECYCSLASQYSYQKQTIPKSIYGMPTLIEFEGRSYYVPEHLDEYLGHLYGDDYMEIPMKSKQRNTTDAYIKENPKEYTIGYTTGVFDLFHIGHLNILKRASKLCDYLIVGVSTDELVETYKHKHPSIPYEQRKAIVESLPFVYKVVPQTTMDKMEAWKNLHFQVMFHGDEWKGTKLYDKYEREFSKVGVRIIYITHTKGISSTQIQNSLHEKN